MSFEKYVATTHTDVREWNPLAEDLQAEYKRVSNAVYKINETLKKKGVKHKLVYFDRYPHYSYRSY